MAWDLSDWYDRTAGAPGVGDMRLADRLGALSGAAGSILMVAGIAVADVAGTTSAPDPTDRADVIAEALVARRAGGLAGANLLLLVAFLMLWFISYLAGRLRDGGNGASWAPTLVLGGGSVLVSLLLVESGFYFAAFEPRDYGGDTQVAKTLFLWGWNSANLFAPAYAAILLGTSVAGLEGASIPRWISRLTAGMLAVLLMIWALGMAGFAAVVGTAWILAASIVLAAVSPDPARDAGARAGGN